MIGKPFVEEFERCLLGEKQASFAGGLYDLALFPAKVYGNLLAKWPLLALGLAGYAAYKKPWEKLRGVKLKGSQTGYVPTKQVITL